MTIDDIIINDIEHIWQRSKRMNKLNLLTDHQYKMIKRWLNTSTKKAERKLRDERLERRNS